MSAVMAFSAAGKAYRWRKATERFRKRRRAGSLPTPARRSLPGVRMRQAGGRVQAETRGGHVRGGRVLRATDRGLGVERRAAAAVAARPA